MALLATACELARVSLLGWPLLVLGFPAAPTPLAQWAYYVGPFGVSWLLYTINFLWLPDLGRSRGVRAWAPPLAAAALGALAWYGGGRIADGAGDVPPPFAALLVQPNRVVRLERGGAEAGEPVASDLDRLTRDALDGAPAVDLIVWPEASLRRAGERLDTSPASAEGGPSLDWLFRDRMPVYRTPCLVGAIVEARDGRRFNSACLVTPGGTLSRYDKRLLVVGAEARFTPGGDYRPLEFADRRGRAVRIGVAICYEMHFPGLPQYRAAHRPDAVVHLNNESWYRDYPGMHAHGTWACQYRAIETRTWQLVCATWSRTAAIDPRGRVRALLGARPGVLRVESRGPGGG